MIDAATSVARQLPPPSQAVGQALAESQRADEDTDQQAPVRNAPAHGDLHPHGIDAGHQGACDKAKRDGGGAVERDGQQQGRGRRRSERGGRTDMARVQPVGET